MIVWFGVGIGTEENFSFSQIVILVHLKLGDSEKN